MKRIWKFIKRTLDTIVILFFALCLLFLGLTLYSAYFGLKSTDTDISQYEEYRNATLYGNKFMPSLNDLGDYQDIAFGQTEVYYTPFFISCSMNPFVQYSEEDYDLIKATALEGRSLIAEAEYSYNGELIMLPTIEHRGYTLHAIELHPNTCPCNYVGFIGFDDVNHAICFLLYNDDDRDYIGEADEDPLTAMYKWLNKEFWWHTFK